MLSGGHLPDDVQEAMGDGVLDAVMADAARKIRLGTDVRSALWSSVRTHWELTLFEDFGVDRTYGDFAWPLVVSEFDEDLDRVVQVLSRAKGIAASPVTTVAEMSVEDFWASLDVPYPKDRCLYCGITIACGTLADDVLSLHEECREKLSLLKESLFGSAQRLEAEKRAGDGGLETSEGTDGHRGLGEREPESANKKEAAESLLGLFEGDFYNEQREIPLSG